MIEQFQIEEFQHSRPINESIPPEYLVFHYYNTIKMFKIHAHTIYVKIDKSGNNDNDAVKTGYTESYSTNGFKDFRQ